MNDELNKLLRASRVPERTEGYWENFPRRVTARLRDEPSRKPAWHRGAWIWGLVTASVALAVGVGVWTRSRGPAAPDYAKLYREIEAMFPNQVRAIIVDEHGVRLDLADRANVPTSIPLRVRVCDERQCRTFITFSGQQIHINGQKWDVLADGRGHVLVVGRSLVWSSAEPTDPAGVYRIEAEPLGASS